jgi:hypothetical protein
MMMGLSIRAYARHRGVSHVAVKKAIDTGRITTLADGTIDPETADAQWAKNTIPPRRAAAPEKSRPSNARVLPEREVPEPAAPPLSDGGTSLLQARTINEVLKAQLHKVELAQRKGELVDRAQAVALVFKLARAERDAWLNFPGRIASTLAAQLAVDEHTLHVALDRAVRDYLTELGELTVKVST